MRTGTFLWLAPIGAAIVFAAAGPYSPWKQKRDLPEARIFEIAAAINGRIYAVTSGEDATPGGEVFEYNPAADTWIRKALAVSRRNSYGAGAIDGRIYIWGGFRGATPDDTVEEYDAAADSWTVKAARMPHPAPFAKGAAANGKLYAVGGSNSRALREYDPRTDRWRERAPMPGDRVAYRVAAALGKIYVIGGHAEGGALVDEYDPTTDKWTARSKMPTPRQDYAIAEAGGLIYAFGGERNLDAAEAYDAGADRWFAKARLPKGNWCQVAAAVNGRIYVIGGGFPAGQVLKTVWEYDTRADEATHR